MQIVDIDVKYILCITCKNSTLYIYGFAYKIIRKSVHSRYKVELHIVNAN